MNTVINCHHLKKVMVLDELPYILGEEKDSERSNILRNKLNKPQKSVIRTLILPPLFC